MKPSVLIACASDWTSPARLPRVLAEAGCHVTALCGLDTPLAATRYVDQVIAAPPELDAYIDSLKTHLIEYQYSWVLIVDDPLLAALTERRAEPWLDGILPIDSRSEWAGAMGSKAIFCELAGPAGLPIPASRSTSTFSGAWNAANEIGFPVMLKKVASCAGLGVRAAADALELRAAFDELGDSPLVLQQFIDGPIGNSVVLYNHGTPICWMSAFKARTFPGPFGPSSARRFMTHPDVQPMLTRLGALTGYHGFGALDWVLDDNGRLVILELNARPVPAIHMGTLGGVDFARAVRELFAGAPTVQVPPEQPPNARVFPMFPEDIYRAASRRELPRPGLLADVPWRDPSLLAFHLRRFYQLRHELKR